MLEHIAITLILTFVVLMVGHKRFPKSVTNTMILITAVMYAHWRAMIAYREEFIGSFKFIKSHIEEVLE